MNDSNEDGPHMTELFNMTSLFLICIFISALFTAIDGLQKVRLEIPALVTPGDTVTLRCLYQMDGEPLYAVNWYKGSQEFFRYVPNEIPHSRAFPQAGINVDVNQSGPNTVVLKNVQSDMTGKYRCEVSADAPFFSTEVVSGHMNVTLPPAGNVTLVVDRFHYTVGEYLKANCTSSPSKPPANITWFLNGKMVNSSQVTTYLTLDKQQYITIAKLSTFLDPSLEGAVHILCQSNLYHNFKSIAEEFVTISDNLDSYDGFFDASLNSGTLKMQPIAALQCIIFSWIIIIMSYSFFR